MNSARSKSKLSTILHVTTTMLLFAISPVAQANTLLKFEKIPPSADGVGLAVRLNSQLATSLFNLALDHSKEFENIAYFTDAMKQTDLDRVHCKAMVWRPIAGSEKNEHNRIHCEASVGPESRKFILVLANDNISVTNPSEDPSFLMKGDFSSRLIGLLIKNQDSPSFLNRYGVQIIRDFKNKKYFFIGTADTKDPFLMCSTTLENGACELKWPITQNIRRQVPLGDFNVALAKATCSQKDALLIEGTCPSKWDDVDALVCSFSGKWVTHDAWGAVDSNAKLICGYTENHENRSFNIPLGPVVTRAWGSRFGQAAISLTGTKLKVLYQVLKKHALEQQNDRNYPIDYFEFGSGEWGMQSVSLRRHAYPSDNLLSALDCELVDHSSSTFRQVPNKDFTLEREEYSCSIHTDTRN